MCQDSSMERGLTVHPSISIIPLSLCFILVYLGYIFSQTRAFFLLSVSVYLTWPHHRLTALLYLYMRACKCQLFTAQWPHFQFSSNMHSSLSLATLITLVFLHFTFSSHLLSTSLTTKRLLLQAYVSFTWMFLILIGLPNGNSAPWHAWKGCNWKWEFIKKYRVHACICWN